MTDLAFDPESGDMYVTTGSSGIVLRIRPNDASHVLPPSSDIHGRPAIQLDARTNGGAATLHVDLLTAGHLHLSVYDACGACLGTLAEEDVSRGRHTYQWSPWADARSSKSGIYFVSASFAGHRVTHKVVLAR